MTVSHTWQDMHTETISTAEDARAKDLDKKLDGPTGQALLRVAALCNRAEFKPGQVPGKNSFVFKNFFN